MVATGSSKGVIPDGPKIKELRKKSAKTQKGLIHGSTVELRTYQRAEQGRPILPEMLQQIAVLLSVDPRELQLQKDKQAKKSEIFRLQCMSGNGANDLVKKLQSWTTRVQYRFEVSPSSMVAELVASLIEYCQSIEMTDDASFERILAPADHIRAVGRINDMLATLAEHDVYAYTGVYQEWESTTRELKGVPRFDSEEQIVVWYPTLRRYLRILFSSEILDYITNDRSPGNTREEAYADSIERNIRNDIDPDWIDGAGPFSFPQSFEKKYRQEYEKRKLAEPLLLSKSEAS